MDQEKIGKFIGELRREKNITQEQLAEKLGVTDKSVSRWENGKTMPDISMLGLLADILGISIQELLNGRRMTREELLELKGTIENLIEYESTQQIKKDIKTNKYIILGNIILVIALLNRAFEIADLIISSNGVEFLNGFLFSLGITFNLIGVYNNSHSISVCEQKKNLMRRSKLK